MKDLRVTFMEDELPTVSHAADRCEMTLEEFAHYAAIITAAMILGKPEGHPIEDPWAKGNNDERQEHSQREVRQDSKA